MPNPSAYGNTQTTSTTSSRTHASKGFLSEKSLNEKGDF